jgi:glucokinase
VAAASLVGGRIVRGKGNLAGEIGHIPVVPDGERCACGQRGCLEAEVGGRRIAARLAGLTPPTSLPVLVADAASGHADAAGELDRISAGIATAVQLVVLTQGSARVVLGGGVIHATPGLVDRVRQVLRRRAAESDFLASLDLAGRIVVLPADYPVAAVGAALLGRADATAPATVG